MLLEENPVHVVLLACLIVENIKTHEAVASGSKILRREENAGSNTRSREQLCDMAVMLTMWESKGPWAVELYNLDAGCWAGGKEKVAAKIIALQISRFVSWRELKSESECTVSSFIVLKYLRCFISSLFNSLKSFSH